MFKITNDSNLPVTIGSYVCNKGLKFSIFELLLSDHVATMNYFTMVKMDVDTYL